MPSIHNEEHLPSPILGIPDFAVGSYDGETDSIRQAVRYPKDAGGGAVEWERWKALPKRAIIANRLSENIFSDLPEI